MNDLGEVPVGAAAKLRWVADYLDLSDNLLLDILVPALPSDTDEEGRTALEGFFGGDDVQRDLRALADELEAVNWGEE